jgi:3-oxoacyl-[acyl-carrier-protein] synthase-3
MGTMTPEFELDNHFLESLDIGTTADWIEERTGIKSRQSALSLDQIRALRSGERDPIELINSGASPTLASLAKMAFANSPMHQRKTWDLILCGTSNADFEIPAAACAIAGELELEGPCFDVNSACSSFPVDLHVARAFIKSEIHRDILVFNVDRYTSRVDYSDRSNCILFGDGAAVSWISASKPENGFEIIDSTVESDSSGYKLVSVPMYGTFQQNGSAVQKFAITRTVEATRKILLKNQIPVDSTWFVGHQANHRMLTSAAEKIGIPASRHLHNVQRRGNQGGAGAPSSLAEAWHLIPSGDHLVVTAVGSGLTWASCLLKKL